MSWFIGVDVGGTFTDFHCLNELTGEAFVHKAPSTPDNQEVGSWPSAP